MCFPIKIRHEWHCSLPFISYLRLSFSPTIPYLLSLLQSITLLVCSPSTSPCMSAVVLDYCTFQGAISSGQSLRLFVIPWTAALQAALSFTISQSLLKLLSIESVMPPSHLILCHPLFLLPSIFLNISVFSNESVLRIRRQKYWSFSFSIRSFQWIFRTDFL